MAKSRISKEELTRLMIRADSVTKLASGFGTYDAIMRVDDKVLRVTTESLNPVSDVETEEITDARANELIAETSKVYGGY